MAKSIMNKKYLLIIFLFLSCSKKFEGFSKFQSEVKSEVFNDSLIQKSADLEGRMVTIRTANNLENRDLATIVIKILKGLNKDYDNLRERINTLSKYSMSYHNLSQKNMVISNEVLTFVKFEGEVIPIPSLKPQVEKHYYLKQYLEFTNPKVYITDFDYGYYFKDSKYKNLVKEMNFYKDHGYTTGALVDDQSGQITLFLILW